VQGASFQGWTLLDALERTGDPARWDEYAAAKSEWDKVRIPIPSGPGSYLQPSPLKVRELAQRANDAFEPIRLRFRELLIDEKITAYGSRGGPSETPTSINAAGWRHLVWPKLQNSTVRERLGAKTKIFNVRVFPILQSTRALMLLNSLSLADAFRRYVLEDPEVVTLGKRVIARCGYRDIFENGRAPGPYIDNFHWSFGLNANELAASFVRKLSFWEKSKFPQPPSEVLRASVALADRCQALQRLLGVGQIAAVGTFVQTGMAIHVHRTQWQRRGMTVEIRNGDLCEPENHRPVVRWSGIMLELPLTSGVSPPADLPTLGVTAESAVMAMSSLGTKKKTAGRESISEALQDLWPDGPPRGLQLQKRDTQIIAWQRKNGRTVVSSKTIRRHLSSEGVLK
jgi:hypothetical protein